MTRRIVRHVVGDEVRVGITTRDEPNVVRPLPVSTIGALLELPADAIDDVLDRPGDPQPLGRLLPPIDGLTEVWASGVTYLRSSEARQQESEVADVYARVYDAERPELFLKSVAWRVCGPGEPIAIRADSAIDVPEPELALVCNAAGRIVGVTVCNDVSSRTIEGENPLYLPQAKIYTGSCALGPGVVPVHGADELRELEISAAVERRGEPMWTASTSTAQLRRPLTELVDYLFRENTFPQGAVLSTGTGIVPELDFTLRPGDTVRITIDGVGTLINPVASVGELSWLTPHPLRSPTGTKETR